MVKNIVIDKRIMDIVNKYVNVILENYKVKAIILFGSYVKGTNHEDSDIDIAIITDDLKHGDRIDEEIYLTKLRRNIDYRIEPELDCYILGEEKPIKEFTGKCIAIIHRINEDDDKLILVLKDKDYSIEEIEKLTYFSEKHHKSFVYKKST